MYISSELPDKPMSDKEHEEGDDPSQNYHAQSEARVQDGVGHVIQVENLCKEVSLSGGSNLSILKNISFDVNQGDSLAIVGKSGSGKTTLLGLLAGLDTSTSGKVRLLDQSLEEMSEDGVI